MLSINEPEVVYLQVKNKAVFEEWLVNIKRHRLFRQSEFAYGSRDAPRFSELPAETLATSEQQLAGNSHTIDQQFDSLTSSVEF